MAHDPKDPIMRAKHKEVIFEAKLKEAMNDVFTELADAAAIENKLTGKVKMAHESSDPDHRVDGKVELMSQQAVEKNSKRVPVPPASPEIQQAIDAKLKAGAGVKK